MRKYLSLILVFFLFFGCVKNESNLNSITKTIKVEYKESGFENVFAEAIVKNNISKVKELIKTADLNEYITDVDKPLHFAIKNGKVDIAGLIIKAGGSLFINSKNATGNTPLHLAAQYGVFETGSLILENRGDLRSSNDSGMTPLHIAIINNKPGLVKLLVDNGSDCEKKVSYRNRSRYKNKNDSFGETPLTLSIITGNTEIVELILTKANPNKKSYNGYPILIAVEKNLPKIAEILLKKGADPNIKRYNSPISKTIINGNYKLFDILLKHGANFNSSHFRDIIKNKRSEFLKSFGSKQITNNDRAKYLNYSVKYSFLGGVKFFLENGGHIDNSAKSSNHLYMAISKKNLDIFNYLLKKGARPNTVVYGRSLLFKTLLENKDEFSRVLLNIKGVNINFKDKSGWTPLHAATSVGTLEIVKLLVDKGADVNFVNNYDISPVVSSFCRRDNGIEISKYLIEKGAVIKKRFGKGDNSKELIFYAADCGNFAAVKYLAEDLKHNMDVKDKNGSYPYFYAPRKNSLDMVKYYVSKGYDVNHINKRGQTALYYAAYYGKLDIVKYLIENGADRNKFRGLFNAPLFAAQTKKRSDVVKYFNQLEEKRILKEIENIEPSVKTKQNDRFVIKNGYVVDRKTNLMWASKDNGKNISFKGSINYCKKAVIGQYSDWRVPTIKELETIYNPKVLNGNGYHVSNAIDISDYSVWSGRSKGKKGARYSFNKGKLVWYGKNKSVFGRALPVRGKLEKGSYKEIVRKIDFQDKDGNSYLHKAIGIDAKILIESLVQKGADLNIMEIYGNTPLHRAVRLNKIELAKILIENKASMEIKNKNGNTPVLTASTRKNSSDMIKLLATMGANLKVKTKKGNSILHELIEKAEKSRYKRKELRKLIELLIAKGADVNAKNQAKQTPLMLADSKEYMDISDIFYKAGAKNKKTQLHLALIKKNYSKARRLINDAKTDIHQKDLNGRTALHWAVIKNDSSSTYSLLKNGADPNSKDKAGKTPIYYAVSKGRYYRLKNLIENGGKVKTKYKKQSLLHIASDKKQSYVNKKVLDLLIKKGINVNSKNGAGLTPLHIVASGGSTYIAEFLINKKAKLEIKDNIGWTPLFRAAMYGTSRMVLLLIKKGANKKVKDKYNKTILQRASKKLSSRALKSLR
ncbi:MAG: DUF1566 domain-containing protein [Desulfobacterales bacterium]|nr:DUF1566 domain-containing protein [Desulfobacterales bacterium]